MELRVRINVSAEYPEGRRELHALLDAALSEERRLTVEIVRRHFGDKAADIIFDEMDGSR